MPLSFIGYIIPCYNVTYSYSIDYSMVQRYIILIVLINPKYNIVLNVFWYLDERTQSIRAETIKKHQYSAGILDIFVLFLSSNNRR